MDSLLNSSIYPYTALFLLKNDPRRESLQTVQFSQRDRGLAMASSKVAENRRRLNTPRNKTTVAVAIFPKQKDEMVAERWMRVWISTGKAYYTVYGTGLGR